MYLCVSVCPCRSLKVPLKTSFSPQCAHFLNPSALSTKGTILTLKILSGDENGEGGIETLIVDVQWNWGEKDLNTVFPPAALAWKNLRQLHITEFDDNIDRFMGHLFANGYVGSGTICTVILNGNIRIIITTSHCA